ncbi:SGNH/GDSL hydrolase family protein [Legionella israelensis]|uniref:lysophospholipase/glycerophospholipid:cholestero l acyltransferase PlaC n=1 Tax=Legionella israelensis TaxID=454 RepID=UPI001180FE46|nr:SGNH/GDSL hydrolase family protein [Legionella israelensis]QDP71643.1 SGNH/GDSL hydrolase family protein [Legionella israelensis]
MSKRSNLFSCILSFMLCTSLCFAAPPVKSIVVFGDSLSDIGNTSHLLKSLRKDENPSYLVRPLKVYVINKMEEFAEEYYVPQILLDAGIRQVTEFFDYQLAPMLADLIGSIRRVPVLPEKPYWNHRFSNGRVWFEYLAPMLGIDKEEEEQYINKAFGGSWAMTYNRQLTVWNFIQHPLLTLKTLINGKLIPPSLGLIVQAYLMEHQQIDSQAHYFIFSGNNDYVNALIFEDTYDPEVMNRYIDNVLNDLSASIHKLSRAGARHFVIIGIPHVGNTPKFIHTAESAILNQAVDQHNQRLQQLITDWQASLSSVADFIYIDAQDIFSKALTEPTRYGFTNITDACIDVKLPMFNLIASRSPFTHNYVLQYAQVLQYRHPQFTQGETNYHVCQTPENYLFWDEIHPSTRAHHYFAYEICLALKDKGYDTHCNMPT